MARQEHQGLTIHHHVWDRAVMSPCGRIQQQRHQAYDQFLKDKDTGDQGYALASLLSWLTVVGCVCHDLSNALRWSVTSFFDDRACMRSLWVVFESLKN
eukprot:14040610-Alexandrium_andersonii.AAC.1